MRICAIRCENICFNLIIFVFLRKVYYTGTNKLFNIIRSLLKNSVKGLLDSNIVETFKNMIIEPRHEISNNVVCATSKAADQLAHMRSLIRAFASRLNNSMNIKLLSEHHYEFLRLKRGCTGLSSLHLSKCHIVGNLMSRLIYGN